MRKMRILAVSLLVLSVLLVGMGAGTCGGNEEETPSSGGEETTTPAGDGEETAPPEDENGEPSDEVEMELTSTAFQDGGTIPSQHTCDGQNISPAFSWSGLPEGTQSLALIVDDSDAPGGAFTHWVIFNIPADAPGLEEAIPVSSQLANGARQGENGFGGIGYDGPCPPPGSPHHYHFAVYALDITLELSAGVTGTQVLSAMEGHILAQAELIAVYQH